MCIFFFSSRRRHTRFKCDWSSDVCSSDLQGPLVSEAVTMVHRPREDVGDGFDAAMRVPGKPRQVILGVLIAKVVEQKERIEVFGVAEAECAAQPHTGALDGRLRLQYSLDRSNGHGCSSESQFNALML